MKNSRSIKRYTNVLKNRTKNENLLFKKKVLPFVDLLTKFIERNF